jgi:two-component system response regulator FlrC
MQTTARVLIVDDETEFLLLIGQYLEAKGVDFELADSVAQARKHLGDSRFDMVISDFNMPGESGFDLFRFISSRYPGLRFVLMSGCTDSGLKRKARKMGICGYLEKPFAMYDLMKLIHNYVPIVGRDEVCVSAS